MASAAAAAALGRTPHLGSDGDANDVGAALLPGGGAAPSSSSSPARRPRPPFDEITSGHPAAGPRRAAAFARAAFRAAWNHWDKALVLALLGTLVGMMAAHGGPETLTALLAWFQARSGWAGWGAFLGIYIAVVALLLPAVWLVLGAGFVFGFWRGLLAVWVGGAVGQAMAFLLARYLLAGCLRPSGGGPSGGAGPSGGGAGAGAGRRRSIWQALDRAMALEGWKLLALLRLCPLVPYNLLNIAAAATSLPFYAFALTSAVAIGPECALFTYTGSVAEGITEIVSGGPHHPHGAGRWVGFGLTAVAAAGTSILATVFVRRAIARADAVAAAEAAAAAEDAAAGAGGLDPLDPEGVFAPPPLVLGVGAAAAGVNPKLCRSAVLCTGACRQACNALTAAKIASLVETYPTGWTDDRLAAELFTPNAALAVTPIGAFEGGLTALEYVTTFSRQSPIPSITNLTKLDLVGAMVTDTTATIYFDIHLVNARNGTLAAPLRGIMSAFFDPSTSRVAAAAIDYPQWADTNAVLFPAGSLPPAEEEAYLIDPVCAAHAAHCKGADAQWASTAACTAALRATPVHPPPWRLAGDNLFCRLFHARFVPADPATHCPHIGPSGGGKCADAPLSYAYDHVDALIPRGTFVGANKLLLPSLKRIVKDGAAGGDLFNGGVGDLLAILLGGGGGGGGPGGGGAAAAAPGLKPSATVELWPAAAQARGGGDSSESLLEALLEGIVARQKEETARECSALSSSTAAAGEGGGE